MIRHVIYCSRPFIIAPMVLDVPRPSFGDDYIPLRTYALNLAGWARKPLVLGHHSEFWSDLRTFPQYDGQYFYDAPDRLGFVSNARVAHGRLVAEAWFDVLLTRQRDALLMEAVQNAEPVELSTALSVNAKGVLPDHVSILPMHCTNRAKYPLSTGIGVNLR